MMSFISYLANGLSLGSIYALIALGYTMVYGIAKMLNFAHGDIIMVGGFTVFTAMSTQWCPVWLSVIIGIIVCTVLGVLIEKVAYKPLRTAPPLAVLITAIGVSYFLQNLALLMIGLTLFINKTKAGKAMLAVSEDRGAAELMGINVNSTISLTFAIGSALAGVASALLCSSYPQISPYTGAMPGIKAFVAAVFGGIGSIPGAMIGGVLLGIIENLSKAYISSQLSDAIVFLVLIIVLIVRPTGIMGKKINEKV